MKLYRVANWAEEYENNRTRKMKEMQWVPMRNRMDGDAYIELVTGHPEGGGHLAIWDVTVRVASRCHPRGTLLRVTGEPHTPESLAALTRLPVQWFREGLPRLVAIGWLEVEDIAPEGDTLTAPSCQSACQAGATLRAPCAHRSDEERNGTERKEGNGRASSEVGGVQRGEAPELPIWLAAAAREAKIRPHLVRIALDPAPLDEQWHVWVAARVEVVIRRTAEGRCEDPEALFEHLCAQAGEPQDWARERAAARIAAYEPAPPEEVSELAAALDANREAKT